MIVQLVRVEEKILAITVEDDGIGFDTSAKHEDDGMGLKSIRSRVKVLNGMMDMQSKKNEGTTVHLEFDISVFADDAAPKQVLV